MLASRLGCPVSASISVFTKKSASIGMSDDMVVLMFVVGKEGLNTARRQQPAPRGRYLSWKIVDLQKRS